MSYRTWILTPALTGVLTLAATAGAASEPGEWPVESPWAAQVRASEAVAAEAAERRRPEAPAANQPVAWQPGRSAYVGNRQGDLGGFGVKWRLGDTEMALTRKGMGWRWQF